MKEFPFVFQMLMSAMMVAMTVTRMPPVKNTVGYFTCNCTDGYSGDGRNCEVSDQLKLECSCQTPKGVLILSDTLFTKL